MSVQPTRVGAQVTLWALVAGLLVAACEPGPETESGRGTGEPTTEEEQLSVQEVLLRVQARPCDSVPEPGAAVARYLTGKPELRHVVHDCQRFVTSDTTFGPLVAIMPDSAALELGDGDFATPVAIATIYNWGPDEYAPLGIPNGHSCLWLSSAPDGFRAAIVPTTTRCDEASPPSGEGIQRPSLEVRRATVGGSYEYPHTARWGFDTGGRHHIGVKCGNAWCAIGVPGFQPLNDVLQTGPNKRRVPGWYDAQHLAVMVGGSLRPGPWAVIYPREGNDTTSPVIFADIEVVRDPAEAAAFDVYRDKLFLLRPPAKDTGFVAIRVQLPAGNGAASADYIRPGGASRSTLDPVQRFVHPHAARGAVRWRWQETDESAWIGCRNGCCDVGKARV